MVHMFPTSEPQSERSLQATLVHETGHTDSRGRWHTLGSDRWDRWKAAMASDQLRPSRYARISPEEDYSESLVAYQASRANATSAAEMRRLFPERFRILDEIWGSR